ncbi:tRNA (guanine-N7-)-methyltransferase [Tieghemostelium lacteum]|uniref:tRNA (guanine-N(7)-)-methyltransferase n=1 Tax=Tieghemostelium lacteum TaxID=361077 RepID=A0A151Z4A0_TIELA|nr:tRNA (guanine-N7-)-methyltransferase [Tieghemostelium lacteum]|eukprot:KYQ88789.1 tRNA (guanine-N7-)-methyltransferase [Tieghemostelium lacteum]
MSETTTTTNTIDNKSSKPAATKKRAIKPYHKIKAHANPAADYEFDYKAKPSEYDWSKKYPELSSELKEGERIKVQVADVGCGYGGLTVSLSQTLPDKVILGMEIRAKVVEYVEGRIEKLREDNKEKKLYRNISVIKTNSMKLMPNFFEKGQLEKIFFLFPDPHFKKANHKRRIISPTLLAEYAYIMSIGGLAYFISDVQELYEWMFAHFKSHPLFQQIDKDLALSDPCVPLIVNSSEEARKVNRIEGKKWYAVFKRISNPSEKIENFENYTLTNF